ncbi:MAG: Rossmann-like domain-containing protein [Adlercreutzia equolifaciens]
MLFRNVSPQIQRAASGDGARGRGGALPHVERIEEYAQLTVLERKCSQAGDVPDPACEYVIPGADYLFMTGVTLINKTAPRLLVSGERRRFVGPSGHGAVSSFRWGVDMYWPAAWWPTPTSFRFAVQEQRRPVLRRGAAAHGRPAAIGGMIAVSSHGRVQMGKTRWLESLVAELERFFGGALRRRCLLSRAGD